MWIVPRGNRPELRSFKLQAQSGRPSILCDAEDQTLAELLPRRNSFAALFFVTIGTLINPRSLISNLSLLAGIVALIVLGKFVIWTAVARLFRYPFWTALMVGVGLTQIGEFPYVLVRAAREARLVNDNVYGATLAASLLTILLNVFLTRIARERTRTNASLGFSKLKFRTVPSRDDYTAIPETNPHWGRVRMMADR